MVNDSLFTQSYTSNKAYIPDEGINKGEKYLIKYNKKKPLECRILFDKPIKSSDDFDAYMSEIIKTD